MNVGERLKFFRVFYGVTQTEIASVLDVSQRDIALMEKNKIKIQKTVADRLAQYFECRPSYFFSGDIPAFYDHFRFLSIPSPKIYNLSLRLERRKIANLANYIYLLQNFLIEHGFKKYYTILLANTYEENIYQETGRIYIFLSDVYKMMFFVKLDHSGFDFVPRIMDDVILPLRMQEIARAKITSQDFQMHFDLPRVMFWKQDPIPKIKTIQLIIEKLSIPQKDQIIADFIDYASNYTKRFATTVASLEEQIMKCKIKEILEIMIKYNIKLDDLQIALKNFGLKKKE